jgi:hypothetical protein
VFLKWLKDVSSDNKDLLQNLSFFRILFDENGNLVEPSNLFFPTTYRDDNELAETAKVMSESFFALLDDDTRDWLSAIGVSEMSNISVIDNILCEEDFITEENSIPVIQFIFDANKRVNIFDEISSYRLSHLRFLTKEGSLKSISELYLCTAYHPNLNIESILDDDIYVSPAYIRTNDNIYDWTYFFQKLGINTSFELNEKRYYGLDAKQLKFFDKPTALANKVGYDSFNGCTYYFNVGTFEVYYFPLIMEFSDESHIEFTKYFWNEVLCKEKPEYHTEYIRGASGFIPRCLNLQNYSDKQYFIDWQINNNQYFPTTMGDLRQIRDVLPNTKEFRNLCGEYFPVLDIQGDIHQSWYNTLNFKDGLTLSDCLIILERISDEIDRSCFVENKRRINYVYEKISSDFDCSNKDNFKILNTWGETHQILSKDGRFESPSRLYLLSSKLSRVDIENQVYHEKSLENNRFASMMTAMGVRFINDYTVDCSESEAIKDESIVTALVEKTDFLTAITTSESFDNNSWEKAKSKMQDNISKLVFLKVPSIKITYGDQSFDKTAYASDFKFYYVEKWGVANQELVHEELSKALNIKDKSTMLAVIRMNNGIEIKEYLEQKGYDVSRISDAQVAALTEEDKDKRIQELERQLALLTGSSKKIPEMGGENAPFGGLSKSDMHAALEEAKDTILNRLQTAGYDISRAEWDGHTCINGVSKDGIEYPLVVRSNRSKSNTKINPEDWNQLMKPNAIFAVNTSSGPGTIRFRDLLKSKDNITIRFSSENIDSKKHIAELAHVLAYFKGIQFDFERYVQPVIGSWERFLAPEQNTGELPQAGSDNLLPD